MKNKNHIQAKTTIERLLFNGDAGEHHLQVYKVGLQWLHLRFEYVPMNKWEYSKLFWTWWTAQWNSRNYELLMQMGFDIDEKSITKLEYEFLREAFIAKHESSSKIYPQRVIKRALVKECKIIIK